MKKAKWEKQKNKASSRTGVSFVTATKRELDKSSNERLAGRIFEPNELSEFEVQAKLYLALKCAKFDVRGEVAASFPDGSNKSRFDLVVFRGSKKPIIIEVKATLKEVDAAQAKKYAMFNAHVLYCVGVKQIKDILKEVKRMGFVS